MSSLKRKLSDYETKIRFLNKYLEKTNGLAKKDLEKRLFHIKLKYDKLIALAAYTDARITLSKIEIQEAETDLNKELEGVQCFKKFKKEDSTSPKPPPQTKNKKEKKLKENKSTNMQKQTANTLKTIDILKTKKSSENYKINVLKENSNKTVSPLTNYKQFKNGVKHTSNDKINTKKQYGERKFDRSDKLRQIFHKKRYEIDNENRKNNNEKIFTGKNRINTMKNVNFDANKSLDKAELQKDIFNDDTLKLHDISIENGSEIDSMQDKKSHNAENNVKNKVSMKNGQENNINGLCKEINGINEISNNAETHKFAVNLFRVYKKIMDSKSENTVKNQEINSQNNLLTKKVLFDENESKTFSKWPRSSINDNEISMDSGVDKLEGMGERILCPDLDTSASQDRIFTDLYQDIKTSSKPVSFTKKKTCFVCGVVNENHVCAQTIREILESC